jgi:hypothetical protein
VTWSQSQLTAPVLDGKDIDAGVIEDARARQRRHRRIAVVVLLAAAIVGGALLGFGGGGNGSGGGSGGTGHSAGGGGPGSHAGAANPSPAPRTEPGHFRGPLSEFVCALAPANPYLPRRAGCVSVRRADVEGDRKPDLVVLYASLGKQRVDGDYLPRSWTLETGPSPGQMTRIQVASSGMNPFLLRLGNVNGVPGDEIFLQPTEISSGSPVDVYSFAGHRLHEAGVFSAGGDSATRERFFCQPKPTPRIIYETMSSVGMTIYSDWRWTATTYLWHGGTLVRGHPVTFLRRGLPALGPRAFGQGCGQLLGRTGDQ